MYFYGILLVFMLFKTVLYLFKNMILNDLRIDFHGHF
jgi:hypothetical protein